MNQKSGGAEKQRDGDTEPMRSKKTKAQRFLAKPLVRRRNRSRTGAESALRVNSKHEYRENCALKFGVCFRPDADVGTLMKRSFAARLASPTIRIRRRLHRSVQREVDRLFERHRTTLGPRPGEGSFVADSFLYCRDTLIEAGPLVWRRRRTDILPQTLRRSQYPRGGQRGALSGGHRRQSLERSSHSPEITQRLPDFQALSLKFEAASG